MIALVEACVVALETAKSAGAVPVAARTTLLNAVILFFPEPILAAPLVAIAAVLQVTAL